MSLRLEEIGSDAYHIYCLFKLHSSAFGIITPYFNRKFPTFPKWFLELLVQNKDKIKRYPRALTALCYLGESIEMFSKIVSALLSGHIRKLSRKFIRFIKMKKTKGAEREGLTT